METSTPGMRVFISARYRIVLSGTRPRARFYVIREQHFTPTQGPSIPGQPRGYWQPDEIAMLSFEMPVVNSPNMFLPLNYPITMPQYIIQQVLSVENSLRPTWVGFPLAPIVLPFPPLPPP